MAAFLTSRIRVLKSLRRSVFGADYTKGDNTMVECLTWRKKPQVTRQEFIPSPNIRAIREDFLFP